MGLISRDDGWRMPDWLWERIEPLCRRGRPTRWAATDRACPTGTRWTRSCSCCAPACSGTRSPHRHLHLELGPPTLPGVGAGGRLPRDLAPGAHRVRPGGGDRLGLAGRGRGDGEGAPGRPELVPTPPIEPKRGEALAPLRGGGRPGRTRAGGRQPPGPAAPSTHPRQHPHRAAARPASAPAPLPRPRLRGRLHAPARPRARLRAAIHSRGEELAQSSTRQAGAPAAGWSRPATPGSTATAAS